MFKKVAKTNKKLGPDGNSYENPLTIKDLVILILLLNYLD